MASQASPLPARAPLPAAVKGLSLVSLFNDFASEMVYPLLPAFVTGVLGGGAVALGALDGAADLTAALLKWVSGRLADRPGWRGPLILAGYATAVLVRPLIAVASSAWQVVGFRVLDRVGKGLRTSPRDAMIADLTPPELRGRAFGFHRAADHGGAVLGSLAAWWFLREGADVRQVIGWSAVPGVVVLGVLSVVLARARHAVILSAAKDLSPGEAILRLRSATAQDGRPEAGGAPGLWPPILALAGLALARLPEALVLLRLQQLGIGVAAIPLLWAALHVVRSAGSYPGGWLADRVGPRATVAAGGLLFAGVMAGLGLALGPAAAAGVFLALGLVAGLTESAERMLVSRLASARLGRGFGAYHAVTGLAALPAGVFFGVLYSRLGGPAAFGASAAAGVVAVLAWLALSPRTPTLNAPSA